MTGSWPCHVICGIIFLIGFYVFSNCLLVISIYVLRFSAIGWGKRKYNEYQGEMSETQYVV